jgi:hypothetical protein
MKKYRDALIQGAVVAGGTFFVTLGSSTDAQVLASATGGSFFMTLSAVLGYGAILARRTPA